MHYVTISMRGSAADINCLHALIVSAVHVNNTTHGASPIAIAFPEYREGVQTSAKPNSYGEEQRAVRLRNGFLGRSMRLFGVAEQLTIVLAQLPCLADSPDMAVGKVEPVPSTAQYCAFMRHKGMAKMTPSRLRRTISRQNSKLSDAELEQCFAEQQRRAMATTLPNVGIKSLTTGSQFSIFVERRTDVTASAFAPDSYGLSRPSQVCALPVF